MKITRIEAPVCALGESPVWSPKEQAFYWVDGLAPAVYRFDWATRQVTSCDLPDAVGSLCRATGGRLAFALSRGIATGDFDGSLGPVRSPADLPDGVRFNDSKVDPAGRVVAGTMDLGESAPIGAAYIFDADGARVLTGQGFTVFNGPCWTGDGRRLHLSDSASMHVWSFAYDPETGTATNQAEFLALDTADGLPDGATFDAADVYWQARNGAGKITAHNLAGKLLREIAIPTVNVTSLAFGGPNLDVLLVTSMDRRLPWQDALDGGAGGVFLVEGVGSRGRIEPEATI
jgi:L-arabinonolactonase